VTHPALVLNADFRPLSYFPLSLLNWQDAVRLVFQEKITVVAEYDHVIRSPSREMRLPSVVALRDYIPMPRRVAFTRFNVFLRDRFRCQYCGEEFTAKDLTFDHVVPRSRGGVTCWENVLAACEPCNTLKGNRSDMRPIRQPRQPTPHELVAARRAYPPNHLHESWLDHLYWDSEIET
jgi:5-methylcytosine-specific restriction endonuclease McrA